MDDINLSLDFMHERKEQGKSTRIDEEYVRDFRAWKDVKIKTTYEKIDEEIYG